MGPFALLSGSLIFVGLPLAALIYVERCASCLRDRKLELQASAPVERRTSLAASNTWLEQRIRVLKQIMTEEGSALTNVS